MGHPCKQLGIYGNFTFSNGQDYSKFETGLEEEVPPAARGFAPCPKPRAAAIARGRVVGDSLDSLT